MTFTNYFALGDSMSIDLYPAHDLADRGESPGHDRVGASSLLHTNDDGLWPEFAGRDLASRYPGIKYHDHAIDGGVTEDVLGRQLPALLRAAEGPALVTLTVGGNDILTAIFTTDLNEQRLDQARAGIEHRLTEIVETITRELGTVRLILTTVYDPTDGTGDLPGLSETLGRLPVHQLERYNDHVRDIAARTPGVALADVHRHFLGHGVSRPSAEWWYWAQSIIEPGARGASEIRRVWLEAV